MKKTNSGTHAGVESTRWDEQPVDGGEPKFWHIGSMCPSCGSFAERRTFRAPEDYVAFVRQLISQATNGKMLVVYGDCALEELKDAPPWPTGDVIVHQLQCADCGQYFHLSANVWNGHNSWEAQTAEEWNKQKHYYIKE